MSLFETVAATESAHERGEDRVGVFVADERTVIVVADGAGGVGDGHLAAEAVVREVGAAWPHVESAAQWLEALRQIDFRISAGESTAVVVDLRPDGIMGASVGDSEAWLVRDGRIVNLTEGQQRKPLLGSGNAAPVSFQTGALDGVLLVATDGFCQYVKRERVPACIAQWDFHTIPRRCMQLVQLPSGAYWDDIGIVAARIKPRQRTRQRYSI